MEVRNVRDVKSYKTLSTDELRSSFIVENLFEENKVVTLYCETDRAIIGSAVPLGSALKLESSKKEMAADYFAERREIGIINIGGKGSIAVDGNKYKMEHKDALYIGKGTKNIEFKSDGKSSPAKYYLVSYPSHKDYPTSHKKFSDAEPAKLGSTKDANKRTIYKYIHLDGIKSSQLVMGLTELDEGSVWNTMPAHTHLRRSEIYLYYNLPKDSVVIHLMGEPEQTRHLVIRNEQAVISPSWSIHCGAATQNYSFIWAMGGENQVFSDMDAVTMDSLK
jgi:4-deoxy-L-threo-5-hexosulose-uronate ketol-isomerase